jgi:hypothetical protein
LKKEKTAFPIKQRRIEDLEVKQLSCIFILIKYASKRIYNKIYDKDEDNNKNIEIDYN